MNKRRLLGLLVVVIAAAIMLSGGGEAYAEGTRGIVRGDPGPGTPVFDGGDYPTPRVPRPVLQEAAREEDCKACESAPGAGVAPSTPGREGGPSAFGYTFTDNSEPDGPDFRFIDISSTGTPVALSDDSGAGPYVLGFEFPFFGEIKTQFYISSNGFVAFDPSRLYDYVNDCPIVSANLPDDIVAVYWDDLNPAYYGDLVYYETRDPCPYNGTGKCLVVQYENYHLFVGGIAGTFEAVLFDNGDILLQFEDAGTSMGADSTTGIENSTHTDGLTYACNSGGSIRDGLAVLFTYPSGLRLTKAVDDPLPRPGQRITYTLVVEASSLDATNAVVSDTLPAGLTFAGPVTLEPPQPGAILAQDAGDLPIVASGLTITPQNPITLTMPVTVNLGAFGDIANTAAVTSTEVITPAVGSRTVLVVDDCDAPGNPIANCSFETGDFSGWITEDLPDPLFPLQVSGAGIDLGYGAFSSEPTHGDYAALHGFDGDGPGSMLIAQDVTLPPGVVTLEFIFRAAWDLLNYGALQNRQFLVTVEAAGGGPYLLQTTDILTALAGTEEADTGKVWSRVPMNDFAGRTIRILFRWEVPESFSGPGFFQLDNVFLRAHRPPDFTSTPVTTAAEDELYRYVVAATDTDPLEQIAFTAPVLPAWLTLIDHGDGTATLRGTPTNDDVGVHAVTLQAQDSVGLVNAQSFTVTVENVNDAPTFISTPVTDAGVGAVYTYNVAAADVDVGDVLTMTAPALPAWLALTDDGDGTATLSGTPAAADVGDHEVVLQVTDGTAVATQPFTIAVRHRYYLPLGAKP